MQDRARPERPGLQQRLQRVWYGGEPPALWMRALAALYGLLVRLRRAAYARGWLRSHRVGVPVIVVGNVTAGGTGKTPVCIALVRHLQAQGWRPGVVSRGYGRRDAAPRRVQDDSQPSEVGDEPLLIARRTGAPVQVDADRVRAARALVAAGCTVIVADDGLQHLRLARDLVLLVRDAARGEGNGRLLPAGPLREPLSALPADRLTIQSGGDDIGETVGMRLQLSDTAHALDGRACQPLSQWRGQAVHAVAGIGHPGRFFAALRARGLQPVEHPFDDHHRFTAADFAFADGVPILMTEKDAVKCAGLALPDAWAVPVDAVLSPRFHAWIDARLAALERA